MRLEPFSALYFLKQNMARCILLMFMLFLGFGGYLGGLYISNPMDNWQCYLQYYDEMADIRPAFGDENLSDFNAFLEDLKNSGKVTLLQIGEMQGIPWTTIMGFANGWASITFSSVEDFQTFCEYQSIQCDFEDLRNGSLIISEMMSRNIGLKIGDKVNREIAENIYGDYTVALVTQEYGYLQYYIDEGAEGAAHWLILGNGISGQELQDLVYGIKDKHPVSLYEPRKEVTSQISVFNVIYLFVIVLLSVILAVTINAAFVGMYQRRNYEFAVYRAIGMSRKAIVKKLVGELLWMDLFSLVLGGTVVFLGLYLFNNLVLYPNGMYLQYFHPTALTGLILCNVMVLLPLIATRCRQLLRADICEY